MRTSKDYSHTLTQRRIRIATFAVTAIWFVMIGLSSGAVAAIFPGSIAIDSGHLYIWASQSIDTLASLTLIFIVLIATVNSYQNPDSDTALSERDLTAQEVHFTNHAPTQTELDVEQHPNPEQPIGVDVAQRRLILVVAVIVGLVLLSSTLEQVLGGNNFSTSVEDSAISMSENNQILPALEATLQELPRNFSPAAYQQYYLTSGWASDIGATGTAATLDKLLIRASVDTQNPVGLVVGIKQYFVEEYHSTPASFRESLLVTHNSQWWRMTVRASFHWQYSGNASALIKDLQSTPVHSSPSLRQECQEAIAFVRSYDDAA